MRSSSERFFIVIVGLAMIALLAAVAFQMITEQKRKAALARLRLPVVLSRGLDGEPTDANGVEHGGTRSSGAAKQDRSESIAAFTNLFPRATAISDEERWKVEFNEVFLAKPADRWTTQELAEAKAFTVAARDLTLEIRRLAASGGPAIDLDVSKGAATELPHLAPLRQCARLLMVDAKVQARLGAYDEAVKDILAGFELGNVIKDEPILICQLVRVALDSIAYEGAESLPPNKLSPDLAQSIIQTTSQMDSHQSFAESFSGEGMIGLDTFERFRSGNSDELAGFMGSPQEALLGQRTLVTVYSSVLARPWLNMDETAYAETMVRIQDAARLPYYQARPVMEQVSRDVEELPHTRVLTRLLTPSLPRAVAAQARDEAFLALLQTGLALELYHTQNGAYPASLDAVAPILGGHVPVDPFTGSPLGYKPSDQSFVLYSVGHDLKDDGGQQGYKPNGQLDLLHGDIVWRAQPKPESE